MTDLKKKTFITSLVRFVVQFIKKIIQRISCTAGYSLVEFSLSLLIMAVLFSFALQMKDKLNQQILVYSIQSTIAPMDISKEFFESTKQIDSDNEEKIIWKIQSSEMSINCDHPTEIIATHLRGKNILLQIKTQLLKADKADNVELQMQDKKPISLKITPKIS